MVLRDAVPQDLVREARRLINRRIGQEGIEPDRIAYYQQNYWFPETCSTLTSSNSGISPTCGR